MFYSFWYNLFWSVHTGLVVVVAFSGLRKVKLWKVEDNVPEVLDHLDAFIGITHLSLVGTEASARLPSWFTYYWPPTSKNDESDHWAVFGQFHICAFFYRALYLTSPTVAWVACELVMGGDWWGGIHRSIPSVHVGRFGEYVCVVLLLSPSRSGFLSQMLIVCTWCHR